MSGYLGLVTSEHRNRPRFMATVAAVTDPLCGLQELLETMRAAFDVDSAVGGQLDRTGEWIGRSRHLRLELDDVYFEWGREAVGWARGSWKGLYDPETGMVRLPDETYRLLLKAKIGANRWDGTVPGAYEVWESAFADTGSGLGPRLGKYRNGKSTAIPGHNLMAAALGVFILWFGWFGFNPGSQLAASGEVNRVAISHVFLTTNLAAVCGGLGTMFTSWIKYGKPSFSLTLNGILAGLVAITAGYDLVSYLLHYPSARCVTFKELFVCKSSYLIRDFDINSRFLSPHS